MIYDNRCVSFSAHKIGEVAAGQRGMNTVKGLGNFRKL